MLKKLGLAFLALLALLSPALAAIGTPTQLGTATGTTTAVITTGADAPVGSLIVVVVAVGTLNIAATSVVDSALNCTTYTALDNTAVASRPTSATFYCPNTGSDLPNGGTITVTVPSTDTVSATAFAVAGMATSPADIHAKQVNGASGTSATNTTTGTLGQKYELVVGTLALAGTSSAFVPNGSFISIGGRSDTGQSVYAAFQQTCVTSSVGFAPSWTTSRAYMSNVVTFKSAALDQLCDSKTNTYAVLGSSIEQSSKMNAYAVMGSPLEQSSKMNAYIMLAPTIEQSSKMNGYVMLSTATQQASKTNAYIVLAPGAPAGGLSFHSFPP